MRLSGYPIILLRCQLLKIWHIAYRIISPLYPKIRIILIRLRVIHSLRRYHRLLSHSPKMRHSTVPYFRQHTGPLILDQPSRTSHYTGIIVYPEARVTYHTDLIALGDADSAVGHTGVAEGHGQNGIREVYQHADGALL